jgi:hypothetical protein
MQDFLSKEKFLIGVIASVTGVAGIFLNIELPDAISAKVALENIQIFWFFLLAVLIIMFLIKFIKWAWNFESELKQKYDVATFGLLSVSICILALWLVKNFLEYIFNLYPDRFSEFVTVVLPLLITVFFLGYARSRKFSLFSHIVIVSFVFSAVIVFLAILIQLFSLKYYYVYWPVIIFPVLFVIFSVALSLICIFKKRKLLSYPEA